MTESLRQAFDAASQLPDSEQDAIASWLMAELSSDRKWSQLFEDSQSELSRMAADALSEFKRGETKDLDLN